LRISDLYEDVLASDEERDFETSTSAQQETEDLIHHFQQFYEEHNLDDLDDYGSAPDISKDELFQRALDITSSLEYEDRDINHLCKWLEQVSIDTETPTVSEKPYAFVAAALENLDKEEVHLTTAIGGLGYQNSKKIVVRDDYDGLGTLGDKNTGELIIKGDAKTTVKTAEGGKVVVEGLATGSGTQIQGGEIHFEGGAYGEVGQGMEDGKIIVDEAQVYNPLMKVGEEMNGGKIEVYDVPNTVGYSMNGGEIHVAYNASKVGFNMNGGKIHIEGDVETIGSNQYDHGDGLTGGEIYVEGEIGEIADPVKGTKIYQKRDGEMQEVKV
jgi:formylmethanofuran dehydrogenase subunit C